MRNLKISTSKLAQICGVSQGTVDRALNDRKGINPETKERIMRTAEKYGYRHADRNPHVIQGLHQIGIVIFNLNNEYFCELVTSIENELRKIGCSATVMFTHYDKQYEIESIKELYNMGVDGIILCTVNSGREFENFLHSLNIPIVTVGNKTSYIPYVGIDDYEAMREQTENAIKNNYENILYFSPAIQYKDAYAQKLRFEGFMSVVNGHFPYTIVTDINDIESSYDEKTVIICSTDYYALMVYFKTTGVDIFGFDNIKALKKYNISIHTVSYSTVEIARNCIKIIKFGKYSNYIVKHILL